jgi:hypothetical protein
MTAFLPALRIPSRMRLVFVIVAAFGAHFIKSERCSAGVLDRRPTYRPSSVRTKSCGMKLLMLVVTSSASSRRQMSGYRSNKTGVNACAIVPYPTKRILRCFVYQRSHSDTEL